MSRARTARWTGVFSVLVLAVGVGEEGDERGLVGGAGVLGGVAEAVGEGGVGAGVQEGGDDFAAVGPDRLAERAEGGFALNPVGVGAAVEEGLDDFQVSPSDGGVQGGSVVVQSAADVGVDASGVVGVEEFFDGVGGAVEDGEHQGGEAAALGGVGVGFGESEEVGDADGLVVLGGEMKGGGAAFVSLVEVHMLVVIGQHGAEEGGGTVDLLQDAFVSGGTPLDAAGLGEGVDAVVGAGEASLPGMGVDGFAVDGSDSAAGLEDDGVVSVVVVFQVGGVADGVVLGAGAGVGSAPDMVVGVGGGEFGSLAAVVEGSADFFLSAVGLDDDAEGVAGGEFVELAGDVGAGGAGDFGASGVLEVDASGFADEEAGVAGGAEGVGVPDFPLLAEGMLLGEALDVEGGGEGAAVFDADVAVGLGGRGDGEDEGDDGEGREDFFEEGHYWGFLSWVARGGEFLGVLELYEKRSRFFFDLRLIFFIPTLLGLSKNFFSLF